MSDNFDIREKDLDKLTNPEIGKAIAKELQTQRTKIEKIEDQLSNSEVKVKTRDSKALANYPNNLELKTIVNAFRNGKDGVKRKWFEKNFQVEEDQARKIMKKAARDYEVLEYRYPGGPISGKIFHKVADTADQIADKKGISDNSKGTAKSRILDKFGWDGDKRDIEILTKLKDRLEEIESKEEKQEKNEEIKRKTAGLI